MAMSEEMKHTPGPWVASDDKRGIWDIIADGHMLAQVWRVTHGPVNDLPAEANAHLMAAAPDLLEALQMLRDHQNGPPLPSYEAGWTKAMALTDAAIARVHALPKGSR
jgi:hypothetical protein